MSTIDPWFTITDGNGVPFERDASGFYMPIPHRQPFGFFISKATVTRDAAGIATETVVPPKSAQYFLYDGYSDYEEFCFEVGHLVNEADRLITKVVGQSFVFTKAFATPFHPPGKKPRDQVYTAKRVIGDKVERSTIVLYHDEAAKDYSRPQPLIRPNGLF